MSSWTNDTEPADESDDDGEEEEERIPNFKATFQKAVRGSGSVTDLSVDDFGAGIDEIEDKDLLREAWLQSDGERRKILEDRIGELGIELPDEGDSEEKDVQESEPDKESESDGEESSDDDGNGWGGSEDDESEEDSKGAEPSIDSVDEMEGEEKDEDPEAAQNETQGDSGQSSGPPVPDSAVSVDEMADRDRRWKIMVWGPPKLFKTHFAYTMPEPVAFLDLEGKADDLAKKFKDNEVQIWQPQSMTAEPDTKFRRALKALNEAIEWLDWHRENNGEVGTIVVDSMSLMWEWAQIHHKLENYPLKDEGDVELSSNFQSSQESDWAVIKEYHNGEFREKITDSPYHFLWTAMERVDFERQFEDGSGDAQFMEPTGEPKNDYKADTIIHARKDPERGKVGDMTGSNFTDNVFVGLKKPTFPKVRDAVEKIEDGESQADPPSRSQVADDIGAETLIDYDPQMYVNNK